MTSAISAWRTDLDILLVDNSHEECHSTPCHLSVTLLSLSACVTIQLATDCLELAFDSLTWSSLQMLVTVRVPQTVCISVAIDNGLRDSHCLSPGDPLLTVGFIIH